MNAMLEEMRARAAHALKWREARVRRALGGGMPLVIAGTAHPGLAAKVAALLGEPPGDCMIERLPDGEIRVCVGEEVCGRDVFVIQPTPAPVGENVLELVLVADALRRAGAGRISAVIPYFGYARQERRTHPGEALGGRVVADILERGRFEWLVALDLHAPSLEGFFTAPLEHLSAVPLLAEAARKYVHRDSVLVSPDFGGAKLAREYARHLKLPVTIVHKTRISGAEVTVDDVVGDIRGRRPIIVDDMVSTAGTIRAAVDALRARGATGDITVIATHALLVGDAQRTLSDAGVARFVTTDTIAPKQSGAVPCEVVTVAALLATALRRLAAGRPIA